MKWIGYFVLILVFVILGFSTFLTLQAIDESSWITVTHKEQHDSIAKNLETYLELTKSLFTIAASCFVLLGGLVLYKKDQISISAGQKDELRLYAAGVISISASMVVYWFQVWRVVYWNQEMAQQSEIYYMNLLSGEPLVLFICQVVLLAMGLLATSITILSLGLFRRERQDIH